MRMRMRKAMKAIKGQPTWKLQYCFPKSWGKSAHAQSLDT